AHVGSFVPAESATIGLVDRIFTRVGASDELHLGQSTFMVEMTETANILHHVSERSLVILDEIGRGTSTLDGLSLAWAIAERVAGCGARTLFATHYPELTDLAESLPAGQVGNLHVAVREWEGEVIFLHRILPGRTNQSYGIHVAKIAGVPADTIGRADAILQNLERSHHHGRDLTQAADDANDQARRPAAGGGRRAGREMEQLPLFTEYLPHPAIEALRQIDLQTLTPLAAFDLLRKLKQELDGPDEPTDAAD
ncbi:MAG: DNA mismatch repair protein MutS, partial [Phycisphaerales bacterium JB038]